MVEPVKPSSKPSKMREMLDLMKGSLEVHIEYRQLKAKFTKAEFDALVAEGFTEEQALILCKGDTT